MEVADSETWPVGRIEFISGKNDLISGSLGSDPGIIRSILDQSQLPPEKPSLDSAHYDQKEREQRDETGEDEGPPILRRFLFACLSLFGGFGLSVRGGTYLYNKRRLIGALTAVWGILLAWSVLLLWFLTGFKWSW